AARSRPAALPSSRLQPRAWPQASLLFCQHRPQRLHVQRLLGHHLFQPPVLIFQLPQPSRFPDVQPAVLRLPAVVGLIADPVLPADFSHRQPRFHFHQNPNDLLLAESTFPHRSSSLGFYTPENSHFRWFSFGGARQSGFAVLWSCIGWRDFLVSSYVSVEGAVDFGLSADQSGGVA